MLAEFTVRAWIPARSAASIWLRIRASSGDTMTVGPAPRARSSAVAMKYTADLPQPVRCTTSARRRSGTRARIADHWSSRSGPPRRPEPAGAPRPHPSVRPGARARPCAPSYQPAADLLSRICPAGSAQPDLPSRICPAGSAQPDLLSRVCHTRANIGCVRTSLWVTRAAAGADRAERRILPWRSPTRLSRRSSQ